MERTRILVACDKERMWQVEHYKKFFLELIERTCELTRFHEDKNLIILESSLYEVTIILEKQFMLGRRFDVLFDISKDDEYVRECLIPILNNSKFSNKVLDK